MMNWSQFMADATELASFGKQRLESLIAYLATIRPDGSPRVHPVSPFISGDYLFVYMEPTSPKRSDLLRDARYALHCGVEDSSGGQGEFIISGRATEVSETKIREEAFEQARMAGFNPKERYILFELAIDEARGTVYKDGQPQRTRWKRTQRAL
jgi:hypothetical protein